ncbi:hypothetical protein [Winogradskyella eximia]|uniref:hypothetical protein n=1 Tax=Winogradskyella eximia TaxID=262006 RepID=UPI0024925885|nr:hypothetical protein [Winogradskyella eximia]
MKILKKVLYTFGILALIGIVIIIDIADRGQFYSENLPTDEQNIFDWKDHYDEYQDHRNVYKEHFGFGKYKFPREYVSKIKLFKNDFLISRLTSKTVSELNKADLITFFNNPSNFDWLETTWSISQSEYILRFYNEENKEIGKIWLSLDSSKMTESKPFTPNMKYGRLSAVGMKNLNFILNEILTE